MGTHGISERRHLSFRHLFARKLDEQPASFLRELEVIEETTFLEFDFGPPSLRRNIGRIGLLHKRVLGNAPPVFQHLLSLGSLRPGEHDKQLHGHILEVHRQHNLHDRSIFATVYVYNGLPQDVMNCRCVSTFQSCLTKMARDRCKTGGSSWRRMFNKAGYA